MNMDTHEWAWAAGFFDGEGSVRFCYNQKNGTGWPAMKMVIGQGHREPLDRFAAIMGGKVSGPRFTQTRTGNPMWRWETGRRDLIHMTCWVMWPWLGTVKRQQFHQAMERRRNAVPIRGGGSHS